MTNKITEELIHGVISSSNIDTISTCKFFQYCLRDDYQENLEFLKSRNTNLDDLKRMLKDHIEVEDQQLEIFSQLKNIVGRRSTPADTVTMTPDLKKVFDAAKQEATKGQRPMFFEDIINAIYEVAKTEKDMYITYFLAKAGYKHDPSTGTLGMKGNYKFLAEFCDDLGTKASKKLIDPLIGRRQEVDRMVEILAHYKKKNPMLTKNGKPRLGPLNIAQLTKMLEETSKPKIKAKIRNALARKTS